MTTERVTTTCANGAELFEVEASVVEGRHPRRGDTLWDRDVLGIRVGGYSTGMRARLALARAVLHEPALLFARRAHRGLDPASRRGSCCT